MDNNKRPHSRNKNVSSGSASAGKGNSVGGSSVGNGGRISSNGRNASGGGEPFTGSSPGMRGGGMSVRRSSGKRNPILILIVIVVLFLIVRSFSGKEGFFGGISDGGETTNSTPQQSVSGNLDTGVSEDARDKRVKLLGNGNDTVTVMVYMCGTDLESKYKMATADLSEMMNASISDKVNVIVETGGCKQWQNSVVSSSVNQIYKIESGKMKKLESNFGSKAMTDPDTLSEFIKYCSNNYPANRNILIFWDHGGGSISGYGYDEKFPSSSSMTLTKINSALKNAGCIFDAIGFDACLMSTLENALVCGSYADYLIASEELEPGTGWYYTGWLTKLSENTSISTVQLSKNIIDDYLSSNRSTGAKVTLSLIDLAELEGTVPAALNNFASSTNELIKGDDYKLVSNARANVRQFSEKNRINQVDLIDLAERIGTEEAKKLSNALKGCVKYNGTNISGANGVSIYFPYESLKTVNNAVSVYNSIGIDEEYVDCIKSFASLESAGQITAASSQPSLFGGGSDLLGGILEALAGSTQSLSGTSFQSALPSLLGSFTNSFGSISSGSSLNISSVISLLSGISEKTLPEEFSWMDKDLIYASAEKISSEFIDPGRITVSQLEGNPVLTLTDDEWSLIQTVELNVYVDDGDGFIDLGLDNTFSWYDDNSMLLDTDGTWLTVNGSVCAYYMVSDTQNSDGTWTTTGRIPALLNGTRVDLQVVFESDSADGVITGAHPVYGDETDTQAKAFIEINQGDIIQFIADYYSYSGEFSDVYELGDPIKVGSSKLKLSNMKLDNELSVTYRLTDIYGNRYWTPALRY
ncbi:MAG: clostripain-related cysteine peptidase [Firmicutes bacterium]|nr:clostripain-related cysteine peptidase [Bacillota bacterium]